MQRSVRVSPAAVFDGAGLKWVVKNCPPDPNAPLHVYAEKESSPKSTYPGAIYVTCRGASVLGKLAARPVVLAQQAFSSMHLGAIPMRMWCRSLIWP